MENGYFKQRYLINDTYWDKTRSGPIFFYTGNEGDIEAFAQNSGFMWDSAPLFSALLVFAEHRYYGTSLPFGNDSLTPDPKFNGYLTSEQALADYAELLTFLKATLKGAEKSPVIGNVQHLCGENFLLLRENFLLLRENSFLLRKTFLPLRKNFLPLRENV